MKKGSNMTATADAPLIEMTPAQLSALKYQHSVIPVTKCGTIGVIPNPGGIYLTVVRRKYYAESTTVTKGRGGPRVKAAGSYGPWDVEGKYPSGPNYMEAVKRAVKIIHSWMVQDGLEASGDLYSLEEVCDRTINQIDDIVEKIWSQGVNHV